MKILLVRVSYNEIASEYKREHIALGISYIASYIKEKGYKVDILDGELLNYGYNETVDFIMNSNYNIIGFTVIYRSMMIHVANIVKHIREKGCNSHITLGGHYPSFAYDYILKNYTNINSIIRFEGEIAFYKLVRAIESKIEMDMVPNLVFRKNNDIIVNSQIEFENNLDLLPFPEREYTKQSVSIKNRTALITSRGCYANCSFCSITKFYHSENCPWRGRSAKNIVNEIQEIINLYKIRRFDIIDDNIFGPGIKGINRLYEFCNELDICNTKITFYASGRANDGNVKIYNQLYAHGLVKMMFGVESGNENSLKFFNKKITVDKNYEAIKLVYEIGIVPEIGYIFFEPNISFADAKANLDFLYKVKNYIVLGLREITNRVDILSGTDLEHSLLKQEVISKQKFSITEGYEYDFKDIKVDLLWKCIEIVSEKCNKVDMVSTMEILSIWIEYVEMKYFYGYENENYYKYIQEIRINNNNILIDTINNIFKLIEDNNVQYEIINDLAEKYKESCTKSILASTYIHNMMKEVFNKYEGREVIINHEITSLFNG